MMNVSETILSRGANSAAAVLHKDTVMTYAELREKAASWLEVTRKAIG